MKPSKLDRPDYKEQVVQGLVAGKSRAEIGRAVGISRSQVSRFANRQDIQKECEAQYERLMESVEDAVKNLAREVKGMKEIPKEDTKNRELAYKASLKVLESAGILPSGTQSPVMVNIINGGKSRQIPPEIAEFLQKRKAELNVPQEYEEIA
jgi:hypothetical protein